VRITQGTFSFLPDFTDEQIEAQLRYALSHGWAISIEYTDDPHPRNSYWELWGLPIFDTKIDDAELIMREVRAAREAFPEHYIKLIAYDPSYTRQTTALAFIVNRPSVERPFKLDLIQGPGRVNSYRLVQAEQARNGRPVLNGSGRDGGAGEP
jgi:ribulose-bisphosphate carboxylase small chain